MLHLAGLYAGGYVNHLFVLSHARKTHFLLTVNVNVYIQPSSTSEICMSAKKLQSKCLTYL